MARGKLRAGIPIEYPHAPKMIDPRVPDCRQDVHGQVAGRNDERNIALHRGLAAPCLDPHLGVRSGKRFELELRHEEPLLRTPRLGDNRMDLAAESQRGPILALDLGLPARMEPAPRPLREPRLDPRGSQHVLKVPLEIPEVVLGLPGLRPIQRRPRPRGCQRQSLRLLDLARHAREGMADLEQLRALHAALQVVSYRPCEVRYQKWPQEPIGFGDRISYLNQIVNRSSRPEDILRHERRRASLVEARPPAGLREP